MTDCRVARMTREKFLKMLEGNGKIAVRLVELLVTKIRSMSERVFEVSALAVRERGARRELLRLAKDGEEFRNGIVIRPRAHALRDRRPHRLPPRSRDPRVQPPGGRRHRRGPPQAVADRRHQAATGRRRVAIRHPERGRLKAREVEDLVLAMHRQNRSLHSASLRSARSG